MHNALAMVYEIFYKCAWTLRQDDEVNSKLAFTRYIMNKNSRLTEPRLMTGKLIIHTELQ